MNGLANKVQQIIPPGKFNHQEWFLSQIWHPRLYYGIGCSVILSVLTFLVSVFVLLHCDLRNAIYWPMDGFLCCISLKTILLLLLSTFLYTAAGWIMTKSLTIERRSCNLVLKRKDSWLIVPWLWDVGFIVSLFIVSLVSTFYILQASQSKFKNQQQLINGENHLCVGHCLIIFAVLLENVWYSFEYFRKKHYSFQFSQVIRPPLYALKCECKMIVKNALYRSLVNLLLSVLLLPVIGVGLVSILSGPFTSEIRMPGFFEVIWATLDIRLIWTFIILMSRNRVLLVCQRKFTQWFLNEDVEFPLPPSECQCFVNPPVPYLTAVLEEGSRNCLMLKYFAYRDLSKLSEKSMSRRAQIYAVSRPGERQSQSQLFSAAGEVSCMVTKRNVEKQPGERRRGFEQVFAGLTKGLFGGKLESDSGSLDSVFHNSQLYIWIVEGAYFDTIDLIGQCNRL